MADEARKPKLEIVDDPISVAKPDEFDLDRFRSKRDAATANVETLQGALPHHSISHHGNRPAAIAGHAKLNAYHVGMFAKFVERLRATPDGDGSLLDHSLLVYGSGMSDGNGHTGSPLPHVLVGGAAGRMKGNRHIVTPENTPMANLLLAIAQKCGVEQEKFGVSKGAVEI